jgi:hypothetical protein
VQGGVASKIRPAAGANSRPTVSMAVREETGKQRCPSWPLFAEEMSFGV